jgi:hypothetical protein
MKTLTTEMQIDNVAFNIRKGFGYEYDMCEKIARDIVTIGFPQVTPKFDDLDRCIAYFMSHTEYDYKGNIVFDATDW